MPIYVAFDTETTGLPPKDELHWPQLWPHIVQFSFIVFNTDDQSVVEHDYILRVPVEVTNSEFHGITKTMSDAGQDFKFVFDIFSEILKTCDVLVAHNLDFDLSMLRTECQRNNLTLVLPDTFCTMKKSVHLCKLQTKWGYKWPTLAEMYMHFFQTTPIKLHNALTDSRVCLRCFLKMNFPDSTICDFILVET